MKFSSKVKKCVLSPMRKFYPHAFAAEQAGKFALESLEAGYRACVDTDYAIKSGRMRDAAALDYLMILLSSMK